MDYVHELCAIAQNCHNRLLSPTTTILITRTKQLLATFKLGGDFEENLDEIEALFEYLPPGNDDYLIHEIRVAMRCIKKIR